MAMIVIPDAPVKQVNRAQVTKETIATPPGIQPRRASARLNNLFGALLSARIYPVSVKRGIAKRVGADAILYNSTITTVGSIPAKKNCKTADNPTAAKSGKPITIRIKTKIVITNAIFLIDY